MLAIKSEGHLELFWVEPVQCHDGTVFSHEGPVQRSKLEVVLL